MPIPAVISDLSPIIGTGPSPNGGQPGGGENPSTFDDYLRAYGAFIAQLRAGSGFANSGAFRIPFFDASGAWSSSADFVRNASGLVGIGVAPSANTRLTVRTAAQTDSAFAADNGVNTGFRVQFAANLTSVGNDFNNPLAFLTNNTERMRIDASGNVGIGTASPGTSLHIRSAALAYPLRVQTTAGSTAGIEFEDPGTGTNRPNIASRGTSLSIETNSAERMRIDASGNVGIGGAPVTGRLDVATDAAAVARLRNTVAGSTAEVYVASNDRSLTIGQRSSTNGLGDLAYLFTPSATPIAFFTSGNERMRIDASGNVGINGTANSNVRLHINPNGGVNTQAFQIGTLAEGLGLWQSTGNDPAIMWGSASALRFATQTAFGAVGFVERMRIDSTGHQINLPGSTTPPTLTVNGQLNITPTSNTNVRISFRGTDGVTRTANITLT
jgi:hypothetical protein